MTTWDGRLYIFYLLSYSLVRTSLRISHLRSSSYSKCLTMRAKQLPVETPNAKALSRAGQQLSHSLLIIEELFE